MFYIFSYVFFSSEKTNAFSFLQARKKSRNGQTTTADESSLSPRQHFSANPLFLLLAPHIRSTTMTATCPSSTPRPTRMMPKTGSSAPRTARRGSNTSTTRSAEESPKSSISTTVSLGMNAASTTSSEDFWDMSIETRPQKSFSLVFVDQLFGCLAQYSRSHWSGGLQVQLPMRPFEIVELNILPYRLIQLLRGVVPVV